MRTSGEKGVSLMKREEVISRQRKCFMKRWLENEEKYVAYLETNILVNLV